MTASSPSVDRPAFRFRFHREYALLLLFLVVAVGLSLTVPFFLTPRNLLVMLRTQAPMGILAVGLTLVILTGGIDLSVGSIVALAAVSMGRAWQVTGSGPVAILTGLAVGAACGALNGLLVTRGRVPALIVTLATLSVFRGLAFALWDRNAVWKFPPEILLWSSGDVAGLPAPLWFVTLLFVGTGIYLARTRGGRAIYALGANGAAAQIAGVPVGKIKFRLYLVSGLLAGLVGVLYSAYNNSVKPDMGTGDELIAITMVVLGGTSVVGGEGSMAGTALGFLTLIFIQNGLLLGSSVFHVTPEIHGVVVAVLLIGALLLDAASRRKRLG